MRGLTILVAAADGDRLHAAFTYAAAAAAAGGAAHVHLHEGAVALLRAPASAQGDPLRAANGLPSLLQVLEEALALGVRITLCQSGLALAGLAMDQLDPRLDVLGPIGLLSANDGDRWLVF